MSNSIIIISGPSGSGKSSLLKEMMKKIENCYFSISTTTREKRKGEIEGKDYFFTTKDEFEEDIRNGYFLEWANVHDNYYGTSIKQIKNELENGKLVILDIDVQGYLIAKEKLGDIITSIFITTPNQKILKSRLLKRATDTQSSIDKRVDNAISEMKMIKKYDYLLVNDNFEKTLDNLIHIVQASKNRASSIDLDKFINSWKSLD